MKNKTPVRPETRISEATSQKRLTHRSKKKLPSAKEVALGLVSELDKVLGKNPDLSDPAIQKKFSDFLTNLPKTHPRWQARMNKMNRDMVRRQQDRILNPGKE